jgi:hypothetical protein
MSDKPTGRCGGKGWFRPISLPAHYKIVTDKEKEPCPGCPDCQTDKPLGTFDVVTKPTDIREALEGLEAEATEIEERLKYEYSKFLEEPYLTETKMVAVFRHFKAHLSHVREWVEATAPHHEQTRAIIERDGHLRRDAENMKRMAAEIARLRDWLAREAEADKTQKAEIARLRSALEEARDILATGTADKVELLILKEAARKVADTALSGATEKGAKQRLVCYRCEGDLVETVDGLWCEACAQKIPKGFPQPDPHCKTCGGSGKVPAPEMDYMISKYTGVKAEKSCPHCKPKGEKEES